MAYWADYLVVTMDPAIVLAMGDIALALGMVAMDSLILPRNPPTYKVNPSAAGSVEAQGLL